MRMSAGASEFIEDVESFEPVITAVNHLGTELGSSGKRANFLNC